MRLYLRTTLGITMIVGCAVTQAGAYAAGTEHGAERSSRGADAVGEASVEAGAAEAELSAATEAMRKQLAATQAQRDWVKGSCVNDKLRVLAGLEWAARDQAAVLRASGASGEVGAERRRATIRTLRQRGAKVVAEAQSCLGIGDEIHLLDPTLVAVNEGRGPLLTRDNPTQPSGTNSPAQPPATKPAPPQTPIVPPTCASCFR